MSELAELLKRVEAATGPDRELDAEVAAAVRWHPYGPEHWLNRSPEVEFRPIEGLVHFLASDGQEYGNERPPAYTASIDSALALKEAKLPGWYWRAGWGSVGEWVNGRRLQGWCHLNRTHPDHCDRADEATGWAATPPLAIIAATLKAIQVRALLHEGQG